MNNPLDTNTGRGGCWLPESILNLSQLTYFEKILLSEINYLDNSYKDDSMCVAKNSYFEKKFDVSNDYIKKTISKFKSLGLISVLYEKHQRSIRLNRDYILQNQNEKALNECVDKNHDGVPLVTNPCTTGNLDGSSLIYNKTSKNYVPFKEKLEEELPTDSPREKQIDLVIEHLCKKTGGRFNKKANANRSLIRGRLKDGATFEQLIDVINLKVAEWGKDLKMFTYLRPKTLFRKNNFEKYLDQLSLKKAFDKKQIKQNYEVF